MTPNSELNTKNTITATGASPVPAVRHSYDIINWTLEEVQNTDKKQKDMKDV